MKSTTTRPAIQLVGSLVIVISVFAPGAGAATLVVDSQANLFGAGHTAPPPAASPGFLPPGFTFSAGTNQILTFSSVTGLTDCIVRGPTMGPDGGFCVGSGTNIFSASGVSGILHNSSQMFLAGVFLSSIEPVDPAPPRLDFTGNDNFTDLFPLLNQSFFIGDGLTGTGSGAVQRFHVPAGATRLFLGFEDAAGFGFPFGLPPNAYGDNVGSLTATFDISSIAVIPEPATFLLLAFGLILIGVAKSRPDYP